MAALDQNSGAVIQASVKIIKTAVVLFNLGGPDSKQAVRPFLFNLFNDPAIISVPNPMRFFLAKLISKKRAPVAAEIYDHIGGKSPILENTALQADALEKELNKTGETKIFIAMRYWHPFAWETVEEVKKYKPDHIILLPLYPQFSTTTTGSSFKDWDKCAKKIGLQVPTSKICCYPTQQKFIEAHAEMIAPYYEAAKQFGNPRILFSAHGLPEKIVKNGDPYQAQVEATTQAILKLLTVEDSINCYQSRVGPLKWIGPSTDDEIKRAGADGVPVVLVPIAFVSEHSETLVELDVEYAELAHEHGVKYYARVPTLSVADGFIQALAESCRAVTPDHQGIGPAMGAACCGPEWKQCPCRKKS